jgi:hypothetical protein
MNTHHAVHARRKGVAATVAALAVEAAQELRRVQLRGNLIQCVPVWT